MIFFSVTLSAMPGASNLLLTEQGYARLLQPTGCEWEWKLFKIGEAMHKNK